MLDLQNNISILTEEQLQRLIFAAANAAAEKVAKMVVTVKREADEEIDYLKVEEVCQKLSVSRTTLWKWEKLGYLKPKRVGRRVLYSQKELLECISR